VHYDGDRKVVQAERPRGAYTDPVVSGAWIVDNFERDVLGHPIRSELSANTNEARTFGACFDFRGFPLGSANPDGSKVERTYDERGLLLEEAVVGSDGTRLTTRRTYDRNGQITRVVQPNGVTTRYDYDGFARLSRMYMPNGSEVRLSWGDDDCLLAAETIGNDGYGATRRLERWSCTYDERGRPLRETTDSFTDDPTAAVALTTSYFHDPLDRVEATVDHRGATVQIAYDGLGRVAVITDPLGNEERFTYDANSNVLLMERRHQEPDGSVSLVATGYSYDERNRQTAVSEPDGSSIAFEYDARDLTTARTDYLGRAKHMSYNSVGDLVEESYDTGGSPIVHRWELDVLSRITAYEDPTGERSTYALDGLGRAVQTSYPNGFSSARTYDAGGNIAAERLGSGVRLVYEYDVANRLARIRNPTAPAGIAAVADHVFTYDGLDRITAAVAGANRVERAYDSRGRILRETTNAIDILCGYDDVAGESRTEWPDGRVERLDRDPNGAPRQVVRTSAGALGSGGPDIATLVPSGPAHFGEATYGGLTLAATYDDRKRLVDLTTADPGGQIQAVRYRYDTANTRRVEAIEGANPEVRYAEYDAKYRLAEVRRGFALAVAPAATQADNDTVVASATAAAAGAAESQEFDYDDADARTAHRRTGLPDRAYTYLPGHRPQTDGIEQFTYSADGIVASDGQFAYRVDALGRIVAIEAAGATVSALDYDALGRPSAIDEPGRPVRSFNYLGGHVVQEADDGVAVRQRTVHPGTPGVPIAYHVAGETYYALVDGRLNLIGLADSSGTLVESYRYDPFGVPTVLDPGGAALPASQFGVDPVFGGQLFLASTGRYLATRRIMHPEHGIFLSPDPLGYEGSASLYVYAAQNPMDLADPEGEFPFLAILVIMAIGAVVSGGLNATRQGIQMSEDPRKARGGFSWGELGTSMGVGAVMAPALVFAPELAIPLAAYGVAGGVEQWQQGNRLTGTFDIVTSLAPFGFKGVRNATFGRGTVYGQWRGLGPAATASVRGGRFTLVQNNLKNFAPSPFGKRIGLGLAQDAPGSETGHVAVIVEREGGGFWFGEKNARATGRVESEGRRLQHRERAPAGLDREQADRAAALRVRVDQRAALGRGEGA
jgi:RHS repeat-associated protein